MVESAAMRKGFGSSIFDRILLVLGIGLLIQLVWWLVNR
jgi:hypothetical protein